MRLYRIDFYTPDEGCVVAWATSERKAQAKWRELFATYKDAEPCALGPSGIRRVEVETTRNGLCAWLNANLNSDNG
jgi:hypothetical protein